MRDLKQRTKLFALDIIRLSEKLPRNTAAFVLGKQIIRSATSIGANYRAACIPQFAQQQKYIYTTLVN